MLRSGGQNLKCVGFTIIFLLYKVISLVGVENLSFQTPSQLVPF